jgi:hypothetical protein
METQQNITPILEVAWSKFAQFDAASVKRSQSYTKLRQWIAVFGVLATFFAIITAMYPSFMTKYPSIFPATGEFVLKVLLVTSPITASLLAAYANKFFSSGDWLITRAGAEEALKDIYLYRTILQNDPARRSWLEKRMGEIQRSVYRGMNGELVMEIYKGTLPPSPRFDPKYPNSDPGFDDLSGEEYFRYRLESELNWHIKKVNQKQRERTRLQVLILCAGAAGALLAALGGGFTIWVALTASLATTFLGWEGLKNLDLVVRNYSKVILELSIIADHWKNLEGEERTQTEFYKMVEATEDMLWSRNVEYIKAMQEALKESSLEKEASLINRVIEEQREADRRFKKSMEDSVVGETVQSLNESTETLGETFDDAMGSLAEEASSDIVQAELAAMKDAIEKIAEKMGLSSSLKSIAEEYEEVEIDKDTPRSVVNDVMSRYPKTNEVNG